MSERRPTGRSYGRIQVPTQSPSDLAGQRLVHGLGSILRTAKMYDADHPHVTTIATRAAGELGSALTGCGGGELIAVFDRDVIYANGHPLHLEPEGAARARWLANALLTVGIVEVVVRAGVSADDLIALCVAIQQAQQDDASLHRAIDRPTICASGAAPDPEMSAWVDELRALSRFPLLQLYAELRAWTAALKGRRSHADNVVAAKRLGGRIIDALHADAGGLLGLMSLPGRGAIARQSDTAVLVAAMALQAGCNDTTVLDFTLSVLCQQPRERGPWWDRQSTPAVEAAMQAKVAPTPATIVAAYEGAAPAGNKIAAGYYGGVSERDPASLLIETALGYLDLTRPHVGASPFLPEMALQLVIAHAGGMFDEDMVALLLRTLGLIPPGSAVALNSGDLAVVIDLPSREEPLHRPAIRRLDPQDSRVYRLGDDALSAYTIHQSVSHAGLATNPLLTFLR